MLLYGADGEAGDETVEEEVVEEGYGQAGDEACRHQGAPVVDVAADEKDGDARADHLVGFGRDEGEGVDKFLGDQREGEDDDGKNARGGDGNHEFEEGAEAGE